MRKVIKSDRKNVIERVELRHLNLLHEYYGVKHPDGRCQILKINPKIAIETNLVLNNWICEFFESYINKGFDVYELGDCELEQFFKMNRNNEL